MGWNFKDGTGNELTGMELQRGMKTGIGNELDLILK